MRQLRAVTLRALVDRGSRRPVGGSPRIPAGPGGFSLRYCHVKASFQTRTENREFVPYHKADFKGDLDRGGRPLLSFLAPSRVSRDLFAALARALVKIRPATWAQSLAAGFAQGLERQGQHQRLAGDCIYVHHQVGDELAGI